MQYAGSNAAGGFLFSQKLSSKMRVAAQPLLKARQFVRQEPGYGLHKGQTMLFDRVGNISPSGGSINELQTMPEGVVAFSQGQLTVNEYGISLPWTGKLDALAEFDVNDITQVSLKNDMAKTMDGNVITELLTAQVCAIPTGTAGNPSLTFDTDGTPSTAATRHVQGSDIIDLVEQAKGTYLVPPYDGEFYVMLASVGHMTQLRKDADVTDAAKYGEPERLFTGEVLSYQGVRFVETSSTLLPNVLGSGSFKGSAIFIGEDPIVEGVAVGEEFRQKIAWDYGRNPGLAWYAIAGWSLTWDSSTNGEIRVIRVTSS